MQAFLTRLFDIREGEAPRALLMFAYIFLVISSLLIIKSVRSAIFLERLSAAQLPYAFMLVAVSATVVTTVYARLAIRLRLDRLLWGSLVFFIANLMLFRVLLYLRFHPAWFIYLFYVWVAIFAVMATSQFWILANYIFNAREAKRLFSFVGAGAISGGIFGGFLTNYLAPQVGTDNLLLVCAGFLTLCMVLLYLVWPMRRQDSQSEQQRQKRQVEQQRGSGNPLRLLRESRHIAYLAGVVAVGVIVANLVDFQYNTIVEQSIRDTDARTAFFGFWLSALSIVSLGIQFFLTSRILTRFGVGPSLLFLPLGILTGAVAILLFPVLWAAILIKVSEGGLKQSINKAGLELLVLPIPSSIKAQAKSFIDVFVDSIATGTGGLLLVLCNSLLGLAVGQISLVILPLVVVWLYLILQVRRAYVEAFRTAIEKRTIDLEDQSINLTDASLFTGLLDILAGDNDRQTLYALSLLENVSDERFRPHFLRLLNHGNADIRFLALRRLSAFDDAATGEAIAIHIADPNPEIRTRAMDELVRRCPAGERQALLERHLASDDPHIRSAALCSAARQIRDNPALGRSLDVPGRIRALLADLPGQGDAEAAFGKIQVAAAIGEARLPELNDCLHTLLDDSDPTVQKAAVISAGALRDPAFETALTGLLTRRHLRRFAREALAGYGEGILPGIDRLLGDAGTALELRQVLPRVVGLIGSQKSIDLLSRHLSIEHLPVRYQVLKALNRLRRDFPMLRFSERLVDDTILREIRDYLTTLAVLYRQQELNGNGGSPSGVREARGLLIRALEEKLDGTLERIFRLLGLRYTPRDMFNAYLGVVSQKDDLRANAVEFLDNILDNHLKRAIIPIVETGSFDTLLTLGASQFAIAVPDERACLEGLLEQPDEWLRVCALFLIANQGIGDRIPLVGELAGSPSPIVRETAELALRRSAS